MIVESGDFSGLRYKVAYPNDFDKSRKYPVLFFFHGAGERGDNLDLIDVHGTFKEIKNGKEFDFICVSPQCDGGVVWFDMLSIVKDFIKDFIQDESVDKSRVFLSGISMGGYMSWQLLMSLSQVFSKAVICCGGGMYWNAGQIKAKVLVFHGKDDDVVFPDESVKMVNAINASNGSASLTLFDNTGHDCWTRVFSDPEIYKWLMQGE